MTAVSYTHLDVYKRQVFRQKDGEEAAQATATFQKKERMGIKKRIKAFKKYHGLSSEDVLLFDTRKFLVEKAKQEDFIVMGRLSLIHI